MEDQQHKTHRAKKERKKHTGDRNPKAFAVSNPGKLQRQAARSHDIKEKRLHVPLVDRLPQEAPPRLVAIVGPPGVGKTTLLKSLIRRYAKETISDPQGPITVVTSKKQRLTFLECPNELEAMVDIAKVADIVLLMIDGNYGCRNRSEPTPEDWIADSLWYSRNGDDGIPQYISRDWYAWQRVWYSHPFGLVPQAASPKGCEEALKTSSLPFPGAEAICFVPRGVQSPECGIEHTSESQLIKCPTTDMSSFYLSGVINGRYPDREVHNLSRFLSVMKNPRPLIWRNSHPYAVIDSFRDVTHPTKIEENKKCDRTIVLSGYLRGTNFSSTKQRVHIPGLGDFTVQNIESLPDPCPTPQMEQAIAKATKKAVRRRLDEKEKRLYAPFSDRSGLKIDGDAIYITREKGFNFDKDATDVERSEGEQLIVNLQSEKTLLGTTDNGLQLFRGDGMVTRAPEEEEEENTGRKKLRKARFAERDEEEDEEGDEIPEDEGFVSGEDDSDSNEGEFNERKLGKLFRKEVDGDTGDRDIAFADSDSDLGSLLGDEDADDGDSFSDDDDFDDEERDFKWNGSELLQGNRTAYRASDLARLMYDESLSASEALSKWRGETEPEEEEEEEDIEQSDDEQEFFKKTESNEEDSLAEERSVPVYDYEQLAAKWSVEDNIDMLRQRFATATLNDSHGDDDDSDDDVFYEEGEGDGDFEDLEEDGEEDGAEDGEDQKAEEPAETLEEERARNARRKEELKLRFEEEDREGFNNDKANARREAGGAEEEFGEDDWYDAQKAAIQKQLDINEAEYEQLDERQRVAVEGYKAGKYARLTLEGVPAEFTKHFNARMPIIVGGLAPSEDRMGFVQVRIKRHRWHKRILKTNDPLIFSLGWRRFQTMPIYSIWAERVRNRMLKYTPEHMHCWASFYGPLIAPNTSFACFNSFSSTNPGFRIAATGTVLSVDESYEIVKKLKLTGQPMKIYKNSAFIKDMFTSSLEVAKFEGAAIKTVSGIRGQIKRALSKPDGTFRATFEDKILMSDLVFLRAWYPIKPHRYYNVVTNLLGDWQAMRLTGEIRREQNIPTPLEKNSKYRKIERAERHFNPLKVPRALAADLPYKSQIVQTKKQRNKTYMQKRAVVLGGEERKARDLMQKLTTIRKDVAAKRAAKKEEKRKEFRKKMEAASEKKEAREKRESKEYWKREGKKRKAGEDGMGGDGKRRR